MEVRFWAATDVGRTRDHNEDNFLVDKKLNLFIVADGMGGHAAGEVASSVAVREVRRVIAERRDLVEQYVSSDTPEGRQALTELISNAIETACARIFHMAQENPDKRGMGTTLSMMLVANKRGFIGHVGDSRIYLVRSGQVHQLTEDHSLINELIKRGRLKPGDAFDSPYKNAVTRAVGVYESVEVDTFEFDVLPGDNYLLCSDGLSCYLDDDVTRSYLTADNVKDIPEQFIRLANDSGGKDNITAIVVRAVEAKEDDQKRRVNEIRQKLDTLRMLPLFKYLGYRDLVKVMNITEPRRFEPGVLIFGEETRGETFYVLLEGTVAITKKDIHLADLGSGGHFGEMAMVDKAPRSATATAKTAVKALAIERAQFYELMRTDPTLSVKLMWSFIQVLNTRLRMTNSELLNAHETIDTIRNTKGISVVAELPSVDPGLQNITALPVMATDELLPDFLFDDGAQQGTDPLLRGDDEVMAGAAAPGTDDAPAAPPGPTVPEADADIDDDDRPTLPEFSLTPPASDDPLKTAIDQPMLRIDPPKTGDDGD